VVGLAALLLTAGCGDTPSTPAGPATNARSPSEIPAGKRTGGPAATVKQGKDAAEPDRSGCPYDEKLTKYLPESTNRIEIMDFRAARTDKLLKATLNWMLTQGNFGTWGHKERGIGVLKQAGIAEENVESLTVVRMQDCKESVAFLRFAAAPDQGQYLQGLKAAPTQAGGKTCYGVGLLFATPLHHVHFLEPTLFVFSRDPQAIARVAEAREPPAVSPGLLQAIRLTRGGRPTAALAARGGFSGLLPSVTDFPWTFTRAEGSFFGLTGEAKAFAYWYAPAERGFQANFAYLYSEEATAAQSEARANETIGRIRNAYESERQTTVPELQGAAVHMFEKMGCARSGGTVTVSWPFDADFVHHFWARP
jgi:hypothetical protein